MIVRLLIGEPEQRKHCECARHSSRYDTKDIFESVEDTLVQYLVFGFGNYRGRVFPIFLHLPEVSQRVVPHPLRLVAMDAGDAETALVQEAIQEVHCPLSLREDQDLEEKYFDPAVKIQGK